MIDRWLYNFFAWLDTCLYWVEKQFIKEKKKRKRK